MLLRSKLALLITAVLFPGFLDAREPEELEVEYFFSAGDQATIGIMEFKGIGVPQDQANVVADVVASHISELGDVRVISKADIQSMLNLEKQKRLAGCSDKECFSEIAGALGMPWMVTGNLSRFGGSIILNLKLIDVRNAYVAGRSTHRLKGDLEDLLEELPEMVKKLFDRVAPRLGLSIPGRVAVSARHMQPIGESPSSVWVITREDIEASGATNLADLLRMVPGVDIVTVSPSFASVSSRLFWHTSNCYYRLLIDGRDAMNEVLGMVPWQSEIISIEDIERIEIIRGPASSMYGASALAGIVSITTRVVPEKTSASIRFAGGEVGMLHTAGRASTRVGNWSFALHGGADVTNSFLDPRSQYDHRWKLRTMAEYELSDSRRLLIDLGLSHSSGGLNTAVGLVDMSMDIRAVRLAYESENLRGRLYWLNTPSEVSLKAPLEFGGVTLATFIPVRLDIHTVDSEVQWTLPEIAEKLLLLVGGGGRVTWIGSDQLLDGDTYADIGSPDYHQTGISHLEGRVGAFVHTEYQPAEWMTVSGSLRFDYNTVTPWFLSPRLAAVFRPVKGHYFRIGMSRAFRKSQFIETNFHPMVDFPAESPITGEGQAQFQEFMSKSIGNSDIDNEELTSFEAGYLGQFLDGKLRVALDVYVNQFRKGTILSANIVQDQQGLPDLDESKILITNDFADTDIYGSELVVRFTPSRQVSHLASWTYRQVYNSSGYRALDNTPKNLFTVGGRFLTDSGLLGSIYLFSRSEFTHYLVENPEGLFSSTLVRHMDNVFLVMGKLGIKLTTSELMEVECGIKLFLPFSPFSGSLFRYHEDAGGTTPQGQYYGGQQLRRIVSAYLQGTF